VTCTQYAALPGATHAAGRRRRLRQAAPAFKTRLQLIADAGGVRFDTKIAIAVRCDLAVWQKLNVTAFLASGLAAGVGGLEGKPYEDGSGNQYLPMFRQPVLVYSGDGDGLAAARERALARGLATAVYTEELFATGNDDDNNNRAAVVSVPAANLRLAGLAVHGPRNSVDKAFKGLTLHS
jgi:hypothetical protein